MTHLLKVFRRKEKIKIVYVKINKLSYLLPLIFLFMLCESARPKANCVFTENKSNDMHFKSHL